MDLRELERPRSIDELRDFIREHNLPLEKMRFFIGEDYRGAKAFGIYRDASGDFVVYKNKASGQRAVRYQGPDEEFAVRELWERMCAEIANQKAHQAEIKDKARARTKAALTPSEIKEKTSGCLRFGMRLVLVACAFVVASLGIYQGLSSFFPKKGYYVYEHDYYVYTDSWYVYDETSQQWVPTKAPGSRWDRKKHFERSFSANAESYASERFDLGYVGNGWEYDFTDTDYYQSWEREEEQRRSSSDDDDSSSSWDWDDDDDWDSDFTDWDSDW